MYTNDVYHKSKKVWSLHPFHQFYFEKLNKLTQQLFTILYHDKTLVNCIHYNTQTINEYAE